MSSWDGLSPLLLAGEGFLRASLFARKRGEG
jgi:hypothetical protein